MNTNYPHRGIIRHADLKKEYGISRVTAWRLEQSDPEFPRKIKLTAGRATGRPRHELDAYFDSRPRVVGN